MKHTPLLFKRTRRAVLRHMRTVPYGCVQDKNALVAEVELFNLDTFFCLPLVLMFMAFRGEIVSESYRDPERIFDVTAYGPARPHRWVPLSGNYSLFSASPKTRRIHQRSTLKQKEAL